MDHDFVPAFINVQEGDEKPPEVQPMTLRDAALTMVAIGLYFFGLSGMGLFIYAVTTVL